MRSNKKRHGCAITLTVFLVVFFLVVAALAYLIKTGKVSGTLKDIKSQFTSIIDEFKAGDTKETEAGTVSGNAGEDSLLGEWYSSEKNITANFVSDSEVKLTFHEIMPIPVTLGYSLDGNGNMNAALSDTMASMAENFLGGPENAGFSFSEDGSVTLSYVIEGSQLTLTDGQSGKSVSLTKQ